MIFTSEEFDVINVLLEKSSYSDIAFQKIRSHGLAYLYYQNLPRNIKNNINKNIFNAISIKDNYTKINVFPILSQLSTLGVKHLMLKGWALKYSLYNSASERPSSDIDILVLRKDYNLVKSLFLKAGFYVANGWQPERAKFQVALRKNITPFLTIEVDLHYQISPEAIISRRITTEKLLEVGVNFYIDNYLLSRLPEYLQLVHSIIHIFLHRVKKENIKLIWAYDIYLMYSTMDEKNKLQFSNFIKTHELDNIANEVIHDVLILFQVNNIKRVNNLTRYSFSKIEIDIVDRKNLLTKLKRFSNFLLLAKFGGLMDLLFPPLEYMKNKYSFKNKFLLPYYWTHRIFQGIGNEKI